MRCGGGEWGCIAVNEATVIVFRYRDSNDADACQLGVD